MSVLWPMKPTPCFVITATSQTCHAPALGGIVMHADSGRLHVLRRVMGEWA